MIFYILYCTVDAANILCAIVTIYLPLTVLCINNSRIIIAKYFYPLLQLSTEVVYFFLSFFFFFKYGLCFVKKYKLARSTCTWGKRDEI